MTNRDRVNQEFHVMAFSFHFAAPNQLLLLYPDIMPKCAELVTKPSSSLFPILTFFKVLQRQKYNS